MRHIAIIAAASTAILASCGPGPLSTGDLEWGLKERHYTQQCIRNGWTSDPKYLARYLSSLDGRIGSGATQDQINASSSNLSAQGQFGSVTQPLCREVEARAIQRIQHEDSVAQREQEQISYNPYVGYQPRYANCMSVAGVTNCYAY